MHKAGESWHKQPQWKTGWRDPSFVCNNPDLCFSFKVILGSQIKPNRLPRSRTLREGWLHETLQELSDLSLWHFPLQPLHKGWSQAFAVQLTNHGIFTQISAFISFYHFITLLLKLILYCRPIYPLKYISLHMWSMKNQSINRYSLTRSRECCEPELCCIFQYLFHFECSR